VGGTLERTCERGWGWGPGSQIHRTPIFVYFEPTGRNDRPAMEPSIDQHSRDETRAKVLSGDFLARQSNQQLALASPRL
jgi:hypothetical protein